MATNIAELKEIARKLEQLLENPQPGLLTWQIAYAESIKKLSEFTDKDEQKKKLDEQRLVISTIIESHLKEATKEIESVSGLNKFDVVRIVNAYLRGE